MILLALSPSYVTRERRSWKNFKFDAFCADLQSSVLCDSSVYDMVGEVDCAENLDKPVQLYNETLTALLDVHAPV